MEQSAGKLYFTPNAIVGCGNPHREAHTYSVSTVFVHPEQLVLLLTLA